MTINIKVFNNLSELIVEKKAIQLEKGKEKGFCSFCGKEGLNLFPLFLKKTFTRADYIHDSGLICPACKYLYETQDFRKKNWIVTNKEFSFLKKQEVLPTLLSISRSDLPFVLYSTKTYKKQGWLNLKQIKPNGRVYEAVAIDRCKNPNRTKLN